MKMYGGFWSFWYMDCSMWNITYIQTYTHFLPGKCGSAAIPLPFLFHILLQAKSFRWLHLFHFCSFNFLLTPCNTGVTQKSTGKRHNRLRASQSIKFSCLICQWIVCMWTEYNKDIHFGQHWSAVYIKYLQWCSERNISKKINDEHMLMRILCKWFTFKFKKQRLNLE